MKVFKAPKQETQSVRLPATIFPRIQELREAMADTTLVRLNPDVALRNSVVLSFAVGVANMVMHADPSVKTATSKPLLLIREDILDSVMLPKP